MSYVALDIFEHLRPQDTHWILGSAELKSIAAGSVLVREDDPSDTIFFIADGLFEVYVFGAPANQIKVGRLGPGEVIGEISWLDRKPVSATVRAVEASSVVALSTALLDRKLGDDPAFAARLLRGIATLAVERLRRTTAELRRVQWTAAPQPAAVSGSEAGAVLAKVAALKALVAAADERAAAGNGTVAHEDAEKISAAFAEIERAIGPQGVQHAAGLADALQAELLPLVRLAQSGERLYAKPRGYAGDFLTIEMIYANTPAGTGRLGSVIDGCMLNLAVARAVRDRRRLVAEEILTSYAAAAKEFHVAALACGPAREIFDVLDRCGDRGRLNVSCFDIDREALAYVEAQCRKHACSDRVQTFHGNLIYLVTGRQELHLAPQDLIYTMNLVDYFSDELATALIDWIHDRLRPGGRVMLGNFHPRNTSRGLMDHVLDWHLTHRDEGDMSRLFLNSKFGRPATRVLFEEEGVDLFAECRKG